MHQDKVLAVDLDGTLIKTDLLQESLMLLLKKNPFYKFLIPFWLLAGKVNLKHQVAKRVQLDASLLPYNTTVIDYIKEERKKGTKCYLVTGSMSALAQQVANHLALFDGVFATEAEGKNLTGKNKVAFLNERFGRQNYTYIGNSTVDIPVWNDAHKAVVVSPKETLVKKAEKASPDTQWIKTSAPSVKTWLKTVRIHQWVKNALLAVPLLTSHQVFDLNLIALCLLGFLAFSLAASSVYVLNDLMDLSSDRQHPSKKHRPFAAGDLSILQGLVLFPLLLALSALLCLFLPLDFFIVLAAYYAITVAYSFKLKQIILLDTVTLAVLYTMRIIAGTVLISVHFSFWLLAFSIFIFLSLALLKRYTELITLRNNHQTTTIGRGYHVEDQGIIGPLGTAAGYIAVLVLALYLNSDAVVMLYQHASVLWLACIILLYWISRMWLISHRGQMDDDPIFFAIKDKTSLITVIIIFIVFLVAI